MKVSDQTFYALKRERIAVICVEEDGLNQKGPVEDKKILVGLLNWMI